MIRNKVLFTGNVQGVGFRYATQTIARRYAVSGFVRNLPDGTVEMIVEGEREEVAALIAAIEERMNGHIDDVQVDKSNATGEFGGFAIRR